MDIGSLPTVRQEQMDAMQKRAQKLMEKDGIAPLPAEERQLNPILQAPQEPVELQEQEVAHEDEPSIVAPDQENQESPSEDEQNYRRNFTILREQAKQAKRERDEALNLAKQMAEAKESAKHMAPVQPEYEDVETFGMNPDDLVEGKHLSKVGKELAALKRKLAQYEQVSYTENAKSRLRSQYADFDAVVNKDTIETFQYAYPELAASLNATQDVYTAGVSAYTLIKKFGIAEPTIPEKQLSKSNVAKPKPLVSVAPQKGDSPLSRANAFANGLTKELKDQLIQEMRQSQRRY